jgi:hypothetical protein
VYLLRIGTCVRVAFVLAETFRRRRAWIAGKSFRQRFVLSGAGDVIVLRSVVSWGLLETDERARGGGPSR